MKNKWTRHLEASCLLLLFVLIGPQGGKAMSDKEVQHYREKVKSMFYHGYDNYLRHAYPYDELKPLSCVGQDTWGSYSLTLVDALDTLLILGNASEFRRVSKLLANTLRFDQDINVSVFETNIRVVGGLLAAHLLSPLAGIVLEEGWPCDGPLLRLAVQAAEKLLPAFDTPTGMPYGTVNLLYGVPKGETPITCTSGCGTFVIEFGTISALTGDQRFMDTAMGALEGLWNSKSEIGLVGNHIDVVSGKWTALDAGIGAGVDSYFEYLLKGAILFGDPKLMEMFEELYGSIQKRLKFSDWYVWANMNKGSITMPIFQSLEAFWPGLQVLYGDIGAASRTIEKYHSVWREYGFLPEFFQIASGVPVSGREGYPLRPELIESAVYLYRATKDPFFLEMGRDIVESIEASAKTLCGYATIKNIQTHERDDRMESFFLAETIKYLYLLFDHDNMIHHSNGSRATPIKTAATASPSCNPGMAGYIFNTEAHPIDVGAIHCCTARAQTFIPDDLKEILQKRRVNKMTMTKADGENIEGVNGKKDGLFNSAHACKARKFQKRLSVLGAFLEE
ncbi:ER degradation-enhancing alpha-mannosidase-like protein 2 [Nematostella vectensis]|uniref:ER degradation-enhancing alpha-mannosidase-like protein 2 n=1 Tax=Nematostella vectensis TaxID=45351 RepID=UPI0013905C2F|nr:ER degradation-enhancing alpha-mannosidase-like protein 2 [Nematostella vectensis]